MRRDPPRGSTLSPGRRAQLTAALVGAFQNSIEELRELASYYDAGLAVNLPGANASVKAVILGVVDMSCDCGESIVESVARSARRRRPHNRALAVAVSETWPFADGLDYEYVDELVRQVRAAGISVEQLRRATRSVLGAGRPPLWDARGPEPVADLIEGLAQLGGHPPRLALVAHQLCSSGRVCEGIAGWLQRIAPDLVAAGAATADHDARMLLLLRRGVDDRYKGEIYFSEPDGRAKFVAELRDQVALDGVPAMFAATVADSEDLRAALLHAELARVEVMLPVRDLLAPVERWDLFGSGPIGELYPVVVRPLERALAMQHHEYVGAANLWRSAWKAVRRAPVMRQLELDPAQVEAAVRAHPKRWCVAGFRCAAPSRPDHLAALERLVKRGVAAMLALRHDGSWPKHLQADLTLPGAVHDHRCDRPEHPVMLLWDDVDFIPGSRR
ncbi:MAG TPA: hypothetical protein VF516_14225 [Kofleriaceae bacterium]